MVTTLNRKDMINYADKRKHVSQMNREERRVLMARLKAIKPKEWVIRQHALDRIEEKEINATRHDLISTVFNCELIEYKIDNCHYGCDERVVVRAKSIVNEEYNLNVVYSLTTKRIVTVWMNHINDRHETLNWSIYDENMVVFRG